MRLACFLALFLFVTSAFAQRGKDGSKTVSGNEIVNEYTTLTADAPIGATSIFVNSNNLNANGRFASALAAGDLVLIIQMQGATINGMLHPVFGDVCSPNDISWGSINSLNNCGNWEYAEVSGTGGASIINLRCGLENAYTASGNVQIVRVPRYTDLTINGSGTITCEAWAGASGGVVAIEVEGATTIDGSIDVSGLGFRGGSVAGNNGSTDFNINWHAGTTQDKGGAKGEGVVGDWADYDLVGGRYAKGAIGNGGGGGSAHNAGGGGGANASNGTYAWSGLGIPDFVPAGWVGAWALEGITVGDESSGGGRGGYAWSQNNQNPLLVGPGDASWGGHNRSSIGGFGGRDLDYSTGKIFMGGGGGGGHENNTEGGSGGNGGGIIFLNTHGTISGSGTVDANGADGEGSEGATAGFGDIANTDGSGGAGAGGSVILSSPSNITGITINTNGGNGGNQVIDIGPFGSGDEAEGPGGGGGGGYIRTTGITGATNVNGGSYGTTNAGPMGAFDCNGATSGDVGLIESTTYSGSSLMAENDTICAGNTGTLTATGSPETGSTITWYDATWAQVGTGVSYTTGALSVDAMYFYGSCPGTDFDTVWVIVGTGVVIDDASISITDESCAGNDGAITGITVSGGTMPYTYAWNGGPSSGADTTMAAAGSYTLVVTDALGCSDNSGPHTIGTATGFTLDVSSIVITDESCAGSDGSITGIAISGGVGPFSYAWNGGPSSGLDTTGASAGSYTLVVTDLGTSCTETTGPHVIGSAAGLSIDISGMTITDANCTAADGSISGITVSGGTTPYTYQWNGAGTSSADTSGLVAGNYTLLVTDDNGCSISSGPHTVGSINNMVIDSVGFVLTDANCTAADGSITGITVSGPGSSYTYEWNGTTYPGADLTAALPGNYTLVVTDNNGCVDSTGVYTIGTSSTLTIDSTGFVLTNANCTAADGSITGITATGSAPLMYEWNGVPASGADTTGLAPGNYTLVVTDGNGCVDSTGVYTVGTVSTLSIDSTGFSVTDANCSAADGSITGILVMGGAAPISYQWNGTTSSGPDTVGVAAGNYTLVVTDNNGCMDSTGIYVVGSISTLSIDTTGIAITNENCGATDGSITGIAVSGGTTPYSFDWNGSASSTADTTGMVAGSYTLTVTDAAGCVEVVGPITVGSNSTLVIDDSGVVITDDNCGLGTGSISGITATGAGTLSYEWNGVVTSGPDTTGLLGGSYTLVVTDANGCVDSVGAFMVGTIAGPSIDTSTMVVADDACSSGIGSITGITASGGTGALNVTWNGTSAGFDTTGLFAGSFNLVVTDAAGCSDSIGPIVVNDLGGPTASFNASPMVTDTDNPLVTFTDASSADVITWDWTFDTLGTSTAMDTSFTFSNEGTYNVTLIVANAAGCTDTVSTTIIVNAVDSLSIPNIITPDGDEVNDQFRITGLKDGSYVAIFNRWGQKIFETSNYLNNWDGRTSAGDVVPDGTYYYIIQDSEGNKYAGHLTVHSG